ncbi:DUF3861 domain-containing protein [Shewanella sp. 5_MG-2023]|uniref:DUF3861 domain-containing protein n=1 Tax=Shewanella sp. 5_MG-2023 TaxID=3062656 RepID=UPI0026E2384E|nr:DUF3861 domain-containing protein [Shewanella sp. 5_MG-2023]MDO6641923.1 DUF3861 domain-containing protein [Shewanella sp. 5_MG-2023]
MIPKINRENRYRITVEEQISGQDTGKTLSFEFQDREDLFNAVENIKKGSGLEAPLATRVAVALRLLGPVMMQNRKHPLFLDFMPHFKTFMKNLKSTVKQTITAK